jgi:hypothetical protein
MNASMAIASRNRARLLGTAAVFALAISACSSSNDPGTGAGSPGGKSGAVNGATGGAAGASEAPPTPGGGGLPASGGFAAAGSPPESGGAPASGGANASGGQSSAGGASSSGGTTGIGGGSPDGGAANCTRADLKNVVDAYFKAMAAHDPSTLKVASAVKATENAKATKLGEGLWKTAGAVAFHRDVLDTERCGTVSEAVIDNQGTATIFGLRLKLSGAEITEIETIVVDPKNGFFPTPNGIVNSSKDDWEGVVPVDQRSSRTELTAAASAYFDLFSNPSAMVPFGKPCNRLENGFQTTQGDCGTGIPAGNLMMTHRRYPVADLEAGIAVGWVLFGGGLLDFHMFKLRGGKIQFINAVVGPSATSWGWPDDPPSP